MGGGAGTIEIERIPDPVVDRMRSYVVLVDGTERARLKAGEMARLEVSPGRHRLRLRIDWASSPELGVDATAAGAARFQCRPRSTPLSSIYWATLGRRRYIDLFPRPDPPVEPRRGSISFLVWGLALALALMALTAALALLLQAAT